MMDVTVIICTYNRTLLLQDTLRSLAQLRVPAGLTWEVLVVDNNSTEDVAAACAACAGRSRSAACARNVRARPAP